MPGLSSTVKLFKKKKKEEKRNLFPLSSLIKRTSLRESFSFLSSLPKLKLFPPSEWNRGILGDNKYSSHSEKILWIGGENLLSSSIKKYIYIYAIYIPAVCQFEKWHRPWLSFPRKGWKEKENKKMGRGGGKGEESVDNNGFDAKGESRDERISRRPDYTRETELLCIEPFSPLPTLYIPWYHPSPPSLLPDSPPWAYFVRIVILPTDSNFVLLLEVFRMILEWLIDVCCCVIFHRLGN